MVLPDSLPFGGGGGGHRRHGACLQAPMGAQELRAWEGIMEEEEAPPALELQPFWSFLRWQILPLRYLSALKFFFPLRKLSSSFHLYPYIEVEFVIHSISFIYV